MSTDAFGEFIAALSSHGWELTEDRPSWGRERAHIRHTESGAGKWITYHGGMVVSDYPASRITLSDDREASAKRWANGPGERTVAAHLDREAEQLAKDAADTYAQMRADSLVSFARALGINASVSTWRNESGRREVRLSVLDVRITATSTYCETGRGVGADEMSALVTDVATVAAWLESEA